MIDPIISWKKSVLLKDMKMFVHNTLSLFDLMWDWICLMQTINRLFCLICFVITILHFAFNIRLIFKDNKFQSKQTSQTISKNSHKSVFQKSRFIFSYCQIMVIISLEEWYSEYILIWHLENFVKSMYATNIYSATKSSIRGMVMVFNATLSFIGGGNWNTRGIPPTCPK